MIGLRSLRAPTVSLMRAGVARNVGKLSISIRPNPRVFAVAPKATFFSPRRLYSVIADECKAKVYDYDKVKSLVSNPSSDVILVDVREPIEFEEGHIPGSVNIPFKSNPGALGLSEEEFEETFGFSKPEPAKELVFYCLGGVRSTAAEDLANTFGYKKRGNYVGSWEDWLQHENAAQDPKSSPQ